MQLHLRVNGETVRYLEGRERLGSVYFVMERTTSSHVWSTYHAKRKQEAGLRDLT
jgi:hypothetical protein